LIYCRSGEGEGFAVALAGITHQVQEGIGVIGRQRKPIVFVGGKSGDKSGDSIPNLLKNDLPDRIFSTCISREIINGGASEISRRSTW